MAKKNTVLNPIKAARISAGLTQKKMSDLLGIPLVTIECWDRGVRTPPEWSERLLVKELKRIAEEKNKKEQE